MIAELEDLGEVSVIGCPEYVLVPVAPKLEPGTVDPWSWPTLTTRRFQLVRVVESDSTGPIRALYSVRKEKTENE